MRLAEGSGAQTVAFRNYFRLVFVTGTMVRGCPVFSVLFCTRNTEHSQLESFVQAGLSHCFRPCCSGNRHWAKDNVTDKRLVEIV